MVTLPKTLLTAFSCCSKRADNAPATTSSGSAAQKIATNIVASSSKQELTKKDIRNAVWNNEYKNNTGCIWRIGQYIHFFAFYVFPHMGKSAQATADYINDQRKNDRKTPIQFDTLEASPVRSSLSKGSSA